MWTRGLHGQHGAGHKLLQAPNGEELRRLLARSNDRPTGVAYVACHDQTAMLHALEVSPTHRRQGSAQNLLSAAAHWAQAQGAVTLSLVVTEANQPARALYERMGMQPMGRYHYRQQ